MSSLIEAYEARAWPIEAPDAVDAVKTVMADRHISREKLAPVFGSKSRLSEFLNRKRGLTMAVANRLHDELQIPASVPDPALRHGAARSVRKEAGEDSGRRNRGMIASQLKKDDFLPSDHPAPRRVGGSARSRRSSRS